MLDRAFRPAAELARSLRAREISCRELLEHHLARVAAINSSLNAIVTLAEDAARKRADELDAELARGIVRGPLHGLPITIKDSIESAGIRTTCGVKVYSDHIPKANAPALQRLIDAGANVFGKSNTPAFANDAQTYNALFGTTLNPWDRARTAGGSSGGGAAAVAAGLSALELGSDIGGSIRIPAHNCGVYGHKPSYGIIPTRGHIPGPPGTLSEYDLLVLGPLARRSADDLDLALDVVAGPLADRAVGWRLQLPPPRHARRLADFRIAAWLDDRDFPVDREMLDVLEAALEAVRAAGAKIDTTARPAFEFTAAFRDYLLLLWSLVGAGLPPRAYEKLRNSVLTNDDTSQARFGSFSTVSHRDWLRAHEARERYRESWRKFFEHYDVLLCPVSPVCAIPHDLSDDLIARTIVVNGEQRWYWEQIAWVGAIGMSYLPATAAPIGFSTSGLPVGIQIVGGWLEDRTTIAFARLLAEVAGGYVAPMIATPTSN